MPQMRVGVGLCVLLAAASTHADGPACTVTGAYCADDNDCCSGLCGNRTCVDPPKDILVREIAPPDPHDGEPCTLSADCGPLRCVAERCQDPFGSGPRVTKSSRRFPQLRWGASAVEGILLFESIDNQRRSFVLGAEGRLGIQFADAFGAYLEATALFGVAHCYFCASTPQTVAFVAASASLEVTLTHLSVAVGPELVVGELPSILERGTNGCMGDGCLPVLLAATGVSPALEVHASVRLPISRTIALRFSAELHAIFSVQEPFCGGFCGGASTTEILPLLGFGVEVSGR